MLIKTKDIVVDYNFFNIRYLIIKFINNTCLVSLELARDRIKILFWFGSIKKTSYKRFMKLFRKISFSKKVFIK